LARGGGDARVVRVLRRCEVDEGVGDADEARAGAKLRGNLVEQEAGDVGSDLLDEAVVGVAEDRRVEMDFRAALVLRHAERLAEDRGGPVAQRSPGVLSEEPD